MQFQNLKRGTRRGIDFSMLPPRTTVWTDANFRQLQTRSDITIKPARDGLAWMGLASDQYAAPGS